MAESKGQKKRVGCGIVETGLSFGRTRQVIKARLSHLKETPK